MWLFNLFNIEGMSAFISAIAVIVAIRVSFKTRWQYIHSRMPLLSMKLEEQKKYLCLIIKNNGLMPALGININKDKLLIENNGKFNEIGNTNISRGIVKNENINDEKNEKSPIEEFNGALERMVIGKVPPVIDINDPPLYLNGEVDYLLTNQFDLYPQETVCIVLTKWGNSIDLPTYRPFISIELEYNIFHVRDVIKRKLKRNVMYTRGSELRVFAETDVDMQNIESSLDSICEHIRDINNVLYGK